MINNIVLKIKLLVFLFKIKKNFERLKLIKKEKTKKNKKAILFEFYFFDMLMVAFFLLIGFLNKHQFKIYFYYYSKNFLKRKIYSIYFKIFQNRIQKYLKVHILNTYSKDKKNFILSKKIFQRIASKEDIYNISYKGQKIGKYIYQSYCRDNMKYTIDISDKKLMKKIEDAINVYDNLNNFFKKNKIRSLIISHTVFIKYGVLALLAKKFKGNIYIIWRQKNNLFKRIKVSKNLIQSDNYKNFKKIFYKQKDKKKLIQSSKKMLKARLSGASDVLFRKNNSTSFDNKKLLILKKSKKPKILILPSCMFDAIMFFEESLFPDNYTWLRYLLNKSKETNFEWYLKPHPDGMLENERVYDKLKLEFPHIKFINKNISNLTFKRNNFSSMFTYQSNAILEFTYMRIPCVIVSDNLQSSFNYAKPILNLKKFDQMIMKADKLKMSKNFEEEIHQFNSIFYNFRSGSVNFYKSFEIDNFTKKHFFKDMDQIKYFYQKNFILKNKNKISNIAL